MEGVYICGDCKIKKKIKQTEKICYGCMKTICVECWETGHQKRCTKDKTHFYFLIKIAIGVCLLFFMNSNLTVNGSKEMNFERILTLYGFFAIPFGWHFLERTKDIIWEKVLGIFGIKLKKKETLLDKMADGVVTEEEVKSIQKDMLIHIILFPTRIIGWFFQGLLSFVIGSVIFPVECIRMLFRKKAKSTH